VPSRIVREGINDSEAVNRLSWRGELFYRRLLNLVDDFGRYEAKPIVLRGKLFHLQPERWSIDDVAAALDECASTMTDEGEPLILLYESKGRKYLSVTKFNQQIRAKNGSKYPDPPEDATQVHSKRIASAHLVVSDAVSEFVSSETETETKPMPNAREVVPIRKQPAAATASLDATEAGKKLTHVLATEHRKIQAPGDIAKAESVIVGLLADAADIEARCRQILASHAKFMQFWRAKRARDQNAFVPHLFRWIQQGDYLHPPGDEAIPAAGEPQPRKRNEPAWLERERRIAAGASA
jgi:hypothetical protein